MLPEESYKAAKLGKRIYYRLIDRNDHETAAQKSMRLIRERKQTFKKNLQSFIGGN